VQAQLAKGQPIRVFTDQYRTVTFIDDLVRGISAIVKQQASGVYHLCGPEPVTPYDIAQRVAQHLGYSPALVQPVTRAELAEAARRPINSCLRIDKARRELGYEPRGLDVRACF
jgi:dTDP-4-dehydrorhamnose reductase